MQVRQGDLLIESVDKKYLKRKLTPLKTKVVMEGEATGHKHLIKGNATLYDDLQQNKIIEVLDADISIVHEEHNEIKLPKGVYKVTQQVEYDPYDRVSKYVED